MNLKPTIILPTKNRAELLKETIEDILSQSYDDFHLIVIDHNSVDNTRELIKQIDDPRIHYIYHIGCADGAWSPKNEGLRNLPKDTFGVLFRDDDDKFYSKHSLSYLVEAALDSGDRFGICTGDYIELDKKGNFLKKVRGNIFTTAEIADKCWFPVKAAIFNIELIKNVGLLPPIRSRETILFAYFMINLLEQGYANKKVQYTGKIIVKKIRHVDGISVENLKNGSRETAERLIRNIHNTLHSCENVALSSYERKGLMQVDC